MERNGSIQRVRKASAGVVVFTQSALRDRAEGKNGEK